jgi:hypothetical protein
MLGMILLLAQELAESGRYFDRGTIDFWGDRKPREKTTSRDLWRESIVGPDGRIQTYHPPPEVVEFLEAPTKENGEKYLAWQQERMERIRKAMQILAEIQNPVREPTLYYFTKKGCRFCLEQDRVLNSISLRQVKVEKVEEVSPLWGRYGVKVTPTLVLAQPGHEPRIMEGFTPSPLLEQELRHVGR